MKARCNDPHRDNAQYYFEKGITYAPEWQSFENFLRDMSERPPGMTLDRIDGTKGYSKDNCRWATYYQQRHNRSANRVAA